jgi:DnaJ-class molecular chaperone
MAVFLDRPWQSDRCNQPAARDAESDRQCRSCLGQKSVRVQSSDGRSHFEQCPACGGSGHDFLVTK